ncbi:MAG: MarR family transcriptional regulator [Rubrivivax sp.]|nr:MarR family transcriptional regulator [Rubrivivax sp.]
MSSALESFGLWIGTLARSWRSEVDRRLAVFGLTESRWLTLFHLSRMDGPVTQRELADAMGVRAPTLVHILDRLENEGLVERSTAEADRRSNSLRLTRKAGPVLQRIAATTAEVRGEIFAGIPDADIDTCLRVFETLADRLGGRARPIRDAPDRKRR